MEVLGTPKTTLPLSRAVLLSNEVMAAIKRAATTAAFAASAADSAIDHLLTLQGVGHDGHAQTGVVSAQISCSAVALNRLGQKDTIPSFPPIEGFLELQGTQNRVHLSESTQSPAHYCDCGRHLTCPPLSAVSTAMVWTL